MLQLPKLLVVLHNGTGLHALGNVLGRQHACRLANAPLNGVLAVGPFGQVGGANVLGGRQQAV